MCTGVEIALIAGSVASAGAGVVSQQKAASSAKRQAASAASSLAAQEKARQDAEILKRSQRKQTDTILTTGQGLGGDIGATLG